jgi:site-specific recombinase XerD
MMIIGTSALALCDETIADKQALVQHYLSSEGGYWLDSDQWYLDDEAFDKAGIGVAAPKRHLIADFSDYRSERLKNEIKFYLLYAMKHGKISATSIRHNYIRAITNIGIFLSGIESSFRHLPTCNEPEISKTSRTEELKYFRLKNAVIRFITDYYGNNDETDRDVWRAIYVHGAKLSATAIRGKSSLNFSNIPKDYRDMVKRFMRRLVIKRSWSYCSEMLMYIRYFFGTFYRNKYGNGFLETLDRRDVENYLVWVSIDYADKNATTRSKAVSFVRNFLDYIQLAEYVQAPKKDVTHLIFDDDVPKRERAEDTMAKVKYVPEPIRERLDGLIHEIEPPEMLPLYILLRESGWRTTDILNLRYDSCLDYLWNDHEDRYIPYLCSEITKTGIPLLKIPIRNEVGDMVKKLADEASARSTDENNPDKYLFNTYEGYCMGLPLSRAAFAAAVQALIDDNAIVDGTGQTYRFRPHSLRHTRALEYTEQGMPISIIQQILGHCSLQMTLHYAKVSENRLYEKWKMTERLNLLHLNATPPVAHSKQQMHESIRYEFIRKNLDAVRVPFGICFKPSKLSCRRQTAHCLDCANFCSSKDNVSEYLEEIKRVSEQLKVSAALGRTEWEEKNKKYLDVLEKMLARIKSDGIVHKNGSLREGLDG